MTFSSASQESKPLSLSTQGTVCSDIKLPQYIQFSIISLHIIKLHTCYTLNIQSQCLLYNNTLLHIRQDRLWVFLHNRYTAPQLLCTFFTIAFTNNNKWSARCSIFTILSSFTTKFNNFLDQISLTEDSKYFTHCIKILNVLHNMTFYNKILQSV